MSVRETPGESQGPQRRGFLGGPTAEYRFHRKAALFSNRRPQIRTASARAFEAPRSPRETLLRLAKTRAPRCSTPYTVDELAWSYRFDRERTGSRPPSRRTRSQVRQKEIL